MVCGSYRGGTLVIQQPERTMVDVELGTMDPWPADAGAPDKGVEAQALARHGDADSRLDAARRLRALVVIPTYNERENLEPLVSAVLAVDAGIDVLVVDDNSPDGTGALAERLAQQTARVHVLHRAGKQGLGTAYLAGFRYALAQGYGRIVEMDADFSHRPEDLGHLLQ